MSRIVLHIDELVLHGFEGVDRRKLGAGLTGELRRLLAERGVPPELLKGELRARIEAPAIAPVPSGSPAGLGRSIGGAVFRGLSGKGGGDA